MFVLRLYGSPGFLHGGSGADGGVGLCCSQAGGGADGGVGFIKPCCSQAGGGADGGINFIEPKWLRTWLRFLVCCCDFRVSPMLTHITHIIHGRRLPVDPQENLDGNNRPGSDLPAVRPGIISRHEVRQVTFLFVTLVILRNDGIRLKSAKFYGAVAAATPRDGAAVGRSGGGEVPRDG